MSTPSLLVKPTRMATRPNTRQRPDWLLQTGLGCVAASALLFGLGELDLSRRAGWSQPAFFFHYALAVAYFILLWAGKKLSFRWKRYSANLPYTTLFLVLSTISAFALNRSLPVFERSTDWLAGSIIAMSVAGSALFWYEGLPPWAQRLLEATLGFGTVVCLYFSVYLLPMMPVGILASILLGISAHLIIPPLLGVGFFAFYRRHAASRAVRMAYAAGVLLALAPLGRFLVQWASVHEAVRQGTAQPDAHLPAWVSIGQALPEGPVADRYLLKGIAFTDREWSWDLPRTSFQDARRHDPLVVIAEWLMPAVTLPTEDRVKIAATRLDARHAAAEKLWSGRSLRTDRVATHVTLFPAYRMAYTEKIIDIKNVHSYDRNQQEALYTFHLPEGGVVTSLSLWIDGREEKGYLTTKAKADSAYRTIVGVEARDPSVVHWQEGNEVTVRVFPCTPAEARRVKIGVTAPLRVEADELVYESLYFEGPSATQADASVRIRNQGGSLVDAPWDLTTTDDHTWEHRGDYRPYWEISCPRVPLATTPFVFDGEAYQAMPYRPTAAPFAPAAYYLDFNATWSWADFNRVRRLTGDQPAYVWNGQQPVALTDQNASALFAAARRNHYSLFPLYAIKDPARALLITRNPTTSPLLSDTKGSRFAELTAAHARQQIPVRTFDFGAQTAPYFRTLREIRAVRYARGSLSDLAAWLADGTFPEAVESHDVVCLPAAEVQLQRTKAPTTATTAAPDHLMRLFAYNQLMRTLGTDYLKPNHYPEALVATAARANVVSPLSSLVVLESQEDYDRFDIRRSQNSLGNASQESAGSVPEPHEWLLVGLLITITGWLWWRSR